MSTKLIKNMNGWPIGVQYRRIIYISLVLLLFSTLTRAQVQQSGTISPDIPQGPPGAAKVTGPATGQNGVTGTYSVLSVGATSYSWTFTPSNAGTFTGSGSSITVQWNASYSGSATIGCTMSNTYGSTVATSLSVQVTATILTVTISPTSTAINPNTSTSLSVTSPLGSGTYTYQWYSSTDGSSFSAISGATATTYATPNLTSTTYYRATALNTVSGISGTSNTSSVTVYPVLTGGTISPSSITVNYDTAPGTITGTVPTGGNGTYTYQWQKATSSGGPWTNLTGTQSQNLALGVQTSTAWFQRIAYSNGLSAVSNMTNVIVYPQLVLGTISPALQSITSGSVASALTGTVATGGSGTYSYQWQSSPDNNNDWTNITGATSLTYTPGVIYSTTYYQLTVTSNGLTVNSSNIASVIVNGCVTLGTNAAIANNYIVATSFRRPGITSTSYSQVSQMSTCDAMQTVQYFDGLGRPSQTVEVKASVDNLDVVQPIAYDQYDREAVKYLPYAASAATSDGSFKSTAIADQATYYHPSGTSGSQQANGIINTLSPFSVTGYEASPLNRVVEQGAPGDAWQISGTAGASNPDNTVRIVYTANDQSTVFSGTPATNNPGSKIVAMYGTNINDNTNTQELVRVASSYSPGTLYETITRNENWNPATSGCAGTTEEYKDVDGHVVLKRTYNLNNNNPNNIYVEMLSTYYVYDDRGNLAFVLPPQAQADNTGIPAQAVLDNLCYQYEYDMRNRLVGKKLPGKGWDYMFYNSLDQLVGHQDSLQRTKATQQVYFTKYDVLGRVITTGYYSLTGSTPGVNYQATIQASVGAITTLWETKTTSGGYTNAAYPTVSTTKLVVNWYDDYLITGLPTNYSAPAGVSTMTKGLLTVTKTAVLNTPADVLWAVHYYDDLEREITTYKQHYLDDHANYNTNNYDLITNTYNFNNQVVATTRQHYAAATVGTPVITIANTYIYDHEGRQVQTTEAIANGTNTLPSPIVLSQADYNEIGQIWDKKQHSIDNGNTFLIKDTYGYNERGWLLSSVAQNSSAATLFSEYLQYNTADAYGLTGYTPQFNGNIASQTWTNGTSGTQNSYVYAYDAIDRLISGTNGTAGNTENNITYDLNGNITGMNRYLNNVLADQLTYSYTDVNGNYTDRLQKLTDNSASDLGFKHGASGFAFTYNVLGDMTKDASKPLTITYNVLDLPQVSTITGGTVTYTYDANGNKLRKVSTIGTGNSTDYIDGIQYDAVGTSSSTITFIQTEEGRAIPTGSTYNYEYNLSDHLGDTRLTFDTHISGTATTVQQDDYMPFGMDISVGSIISPQNYYLYNKKELQAETNLYDYGARFYDAVIARWTSIDPIAEFHPDVTSYNYAMNNPINFIDIFGLDTVNVNSNTPVHKGDVIDLGNGKYSTASSDEAKVTAKKDDNDADDQNSSSDHDKEAEYWDKHSFSHYIPGNYKTGPHKGESICGHCALHIRLGLEAGGLNTSDRPQSTKSAKNYGPYLMLKGYKVVSPDGYNAKKGDIRVWQPYPHGNPNGHIDAYDGKQWVSDFKERSDGPGPGYRKNPDFEIYRRGQ